MGKRKMRLNMSLVGDGSPCRFCESNEKCTSIQCNDWKSWFLEAWDRECRRLREAWGLEDDDE